MKLALLKAHLPGIKNYLCHHIGAAMDHSIYSHSNLVFRNGMSGSSWADGGVQIKAIPYDQTKWDFFTLPDELEARAHAWFRVNTGVPYDHKGVLRFATPLFKQSETAIYCHEAHALALQWHEPWRYGPGLLLANCIDRYNSVKCESPWYEPVKIHPIVQSEIDRIADKY